MNGFWWGSTSAKRNTHWLSWKCMAIPKSHGGLGFRSLKEFNTAMLAKQGWRLLTNPSSLAARVLKAKYFLDRDFLNAQIRPHSRPSFTWQSIMSTQSLLKSGCRRVIGDGLSISAWNDA